MNNILRKCCFLFAFILMYTLSPGQDVYFDWVKRVGSPEDDRIQNILLDDAGNIYGTGNFGGTAEFDPGVGSHLLTSAGSKDVFLQKLDANGNFVWVRQIGGASEETSNSVVLSDSGYIFITGYFTGTVDFDPGASVTNLTSSGYEDTYVAKFDTAGNFIWARNIGAGGPEFSTGLAVDASGSVYVGGVFYQDGDFDPGPSVFNLNNAGSSDFFIIKLDPAGNFTWAKSYGNTGIDGLHGIDLYGDELLLVGTFDDTVDFNPLGGGDSLISAGNRDIYVLKLDTSGGYIWANRIGGSFLESCHGIRLAPNGDVFLAGVFSDTVDFDPGPLVYNFIAKSSADIFLLRLSSAGILKWVRTFGSSISAFNQANDITLDNEYNVYMAGAFYDTLNFDQGISSAVLIAQAGMPDGYCAKYDSSGHFKWAKLISGDNQEILTGIRLNHSEDVFVSGFYRSTVDFNPESVQQNLILSYGGFDAFYLKLQSCSDSVSIQETSCISYTVPSGDETYYLSGFYSDTITNMHGCDSLIYIDLSIINIDTAVVQNGPTLTALDTAANYQWYDCNAQTIISGENSQNYTATSNGSYAVILENSACIDTSYCFTIDNIGIEEIVQNGFNIFPNPSDGSFVLQFDEDISNCLLSIYGISGKEVYRNLIPSDKSMILNMNIEAGVYILLIRGNDRVYNRKLIIQ